MGHCRVGFLVPPVMQIAAKRFVRFFLVWPFDTMSGEKLDRSDLAFELNDRCRQRVGVLQLFRVNVFKHRGSARVS